MEKLSLREAVKHFDVSRPTLSKALKNGVLSGVRDGQGNWTIDPAELARLYRPRVADAVNAVKGDADKLPTANRLLPAKDDAEILALRERLADAEKRAAVAEALAEERAARIDDLRRMLPAPDAKPRPSWWPWRR